MANANENRNNINKENEKKAENYKIALQFAKKLKKMTKPAIYWNVSITKIMENIDEFKELNLDNPYEEANFLDKYDIVTPTEYGLRKLNEEMNLDRLNSFFFNAKMENVKNDVFA